MAMQFKTVPTDMCNSYNCYAFTLFHCQMIRNETY